MTPYTPLHEHHLAHATAIVSPPAVGATGKAAQGGEGTGKGAARGEVMQVEGYTLKEAAGVFGLLGRLGKTGAGAQGM